MKSLKLKKQDGNDIIAYGGAKFVSALIKQGLIDELNFVHKSNCNWKRIANFRRTRRKAKFTACQIEII